MSIRRAIVEADTRALNVTEFCSQHGVSTWFFWDLRRRYAVEGDVVLEPRSRAPRHVANKTSAAIEDVVVAKRKELTDAGLDAGPASISWHLRDLEGLPSESTIWRMLRARGFITPDPSKAPMRPGRRFEAERANDLWQVDDTTWELADGTEVKIFNAIDDHSRLLVASVAMVTCTGARCLTALAAAAATLGWPARFLSDNANAFCIVLADALRALGVTHGHSRPYHPQTCGKVERFHQTLKKWLAKQPPAATIDELQTQLDIFRHLYNHQRPHRANQRRPPAPVWADAPKGAPASQPITAPTHTWTTTVTDGRAHAGSRLRITLGAAYDGRQATTILTGTSCHVFIDGKLARSLTIDPTRRNQPLHPRPGRPSQLP